MIMRGHDLDGGVGHENRICREVQRERDERGKKERNKNVGSKEAKKQRRGKKQNPGVTDLFPIPDTLEPFGI